MATAIIQRNLSTLFSPTPNQFPSAPKTFSDFIETISECLTQQKYDDFEAYFELNVERFQDPLQTSQDLDNLLEEFLEKSDDPINCIKALRLANAMQSHQISPMWSLIAQAICFRQLKNDSQFNELIMKMVLTDTSSDIKIKYRDTLTGHIGIYTRLEKTTLKEHLTAIVNSYRAKALSLGLYFQLGIGAIRV